MVPTACGYDPPLCKVAVLRVPSLLMQLDAVTKQHHSWPAEGPQQAWPHAAEADRHQPLGGGSMLDEWSRRSTRAGMLASNSAALAELRQRLGLPAQGPAELSGEAASQLREEVQP